MASPNAPHTTKTTLRWLAYGLVGLMAVGALAPLASAQDDEIPAPPAEETEKDHSKKCKWLRLCKSPKHFPPGEFNETNGFVSGRYLEFTYNATSGVIEDVYAKFHKKNHTASVKLFDSVTLAPFNAANATLNVSGSKVTIKTDGAMYVAHDVRRSLVGGAARNGDYELEYDLADGCESKLVRRGVAVNCDGLQGLIRPRGESTGLTLEDSVVTIEIDDKGAGAFSLIPPKSRRVEAWLKEHRDEARDRAEERLREEAREHADEFRDRARERMRDRMGDRDGSGGENNTTAAP